MKKIIFLIGLFSVFLGPVSYAITLTDLSGGTHPVTFNSCGGPINYTPTQKTTSGNYLCQNVLTGGDDCAYRAVYQDQNGQPTGSSVVFDCFGNNPDSTWTFSIVVHPDGSVQPQ